MRYFGHNTAEDDILATVKAVMDERRLTVYQIVKILYRVLAYYIEQLP